MSDNNNYFSPMEIDGIGEILNISLGSSATAMSDMLGRKVTITTPTVRVRDYEEFEISEVEPAVGV
ncbi:chemotaxis protein CheC, partial [Aminipila sp.]